MKAERLFRVLGLIDPALVEEAAPVRRQWAWKRWGVLAACLALMIGVGWIATHFGMGGGSSGGSSSPSAGDGSAGGGGIEDGTVFMSYAGPVFPLAAVEDPAGLTAEREVTWDFAPGAYPDGTPRQWGVEVTDAYVLSNAADEDITVTALYPFSGSFSRLAEIHPGVTVDGDTVEAALYAGAYSGGFQSTYGAETPDTMNLADLDSWEGYKTLLESGEYLARALEDYPVLDMPVTVYEFSDFEAPHDQYPAATQAVTLEIDENVSRVFTYGFNGLDWDGGGFRQYSYFVPDGVRNEPNLKMLIILGEDIGGYTLRGYQDGGCDEGEEIEGVSCTVTRTETTFDGVLERLCRHYREEWCGEDRRDALEWIPFALHQGAVSELLTQYGALSDEPMDRYDIGFLDDILNIFDETIWHDRVLYLAFPVTVPAGGSAEVRCEFWKAPSFDYACSGSEHVGLQGYDLVTRLGSGLAFTSQRAALAHTEGVELAGQNFGFDLENGIAAVELDPEQEHYYMEIRAKET